MSENPEIISKIVEKNESIATVDDLLTPSDVEKATSEVVLKSGKVVIIRKLTRAEALGFRHKKLDAVVFERKVIAMGLLEPRMTQAQVAQWQQIDEPMGDIEKVTNEILRLSGMNRTKEVDKSNLQNGRNRP